MIRRKALNLNKRLFFIELKLLFNFRSLGCILYDLVALEHPFQGKTLMGVMYKITEEDPPPWPDMYSSDLKELFHK